MWKARQATRHSDSPSQACILALKFSKSFDNDLKKENRLAVGDVFSCPT